MRDSDLFKELVWDNVIKRTLNYLFLSVPLLGWGPIGLVISHFVFKFSDQAYIFLSNFIAVNEIVLRNKEHQKAYDKAAIGLKLSYDAYGSNSNEFKLERKKRNEAMANLIVFNIK
jgi:hypothetical protein